jgi:hypothetical protein
VGKHLLNTELLSLDLKPIDFFLIDLFVSYSLSITADYVDKAGRRYYKFDRDLAERLEPKLSCGKPALIAQRMNVLVGARVLTRTGVGESYYATAERYDQLYGFSDLVDVEQKKVKSVMTEEDWAALVEQARSEFFKSVNDEYQRSSLASGDVRNYELLWKKKYIEFIGYWAEPLTPKKRKLKEVLRWQSEPAFDIKKRMLVFKKDRFNNSGSNSGPKLENW